MAISRLVPAAAMLLSVLLPPAPAADLPRKADFTINMVDGKTLSLSQYRGRAVILAFILTTCSHCQNAVGVLTKLQNEYGPRGLQVLASAIENNAQAAVPNFVSTFKPSFPVGYSQGQVAGGFLQPTGKSPMMPLLAFIDRQGMLQAQTEGEEPFFNDLEGNLRKQIELLLKGPVPPKKSVPSKATAPKK